MSVDYRGSQYPLQSASPGDGVSHDRFSFDREVTETPDPDLFSAVLDAIEREDQQIDLEELVKIRTDAEEEMPRLIRAFSRILSHLQREAKLDANTRANLHWAASQEQPNILSIACRIAAAPSASMHDVIADFHRQRLLQRPDRNSAQPAPRAR